MRRFQFGVPRYIFTSIGQYDESLSVVVEKEKEISLIIHRLFLKVT